MRTQRLLGTRFVRTHPKIRRDVYRRAYGRLASFRRALRKFRHDNGSRFAVLIALLKSLTAKRAANRYQPLRATPDHFVEPSKAGRRRKGAPWNVRLRKFHAIKRMERFGLDIDGDAAMVKNERRLLRNARKRERNERA